MESQIRVLILEDNSSDLELIKRELRKVKPDHVIEWTDCRENFLTALKRFIPDLLLLDYSLPGFDGLSALAAARRQIPDIPAIIVSGAIGEEAAIETLKAGATDYVLKQRLNRLGPVIDRALREADQTAQRKRDEIIIYRNNLIFQTINQIYEKSVSCTSFSELGQACLDIVNSVIKSKMGFIGEIGEDGQLHEIALNSGRETGNMPGRPVIQHPEIAKFFKSIAEHKTSLMINAPSSRPDSTGTPAGHFSVDSFLGIPYIQNNRVTGLFSVANREGGYTEEDKELLEAITPTILEVLLRRRAEEKLRESENILRIILEGAADPVYLKDRNSRILMCNAATEAVTGKTVEEMIGNDDYSHYSDHETARAIIENDRRIMNSDGAEVVEERVFSNGDTKTYLSTKTPWRDTQGNVIGIIGVARDITEIKRAEEALRESKVQLKEELDGSSLLQRISTEMMSGNDDQAIYEKLLDTAVEIMKSDYASIQMLDKEGDSTHELHMLANRGFNEKAAEFWEWVGVSAATTCGEALRSGRRIIVADMDRCDWLQGTEDLKIYLQAGIHACQTTPLMSRRGKRVGMISTHWREPHEPTERQFRLFDVLARQAADFIERRKDEEAIRESERNAIALIEELNKVKDDLSNQVEVLNKLQEINSHFIHQEDIQAIYDEILDAAIKFTHSDFGNMRIARDGGRLELIAAQGFSETYLEFFHFVDGLYTTCDQAAKEKKRVITKDITKDPVYAGTPGLNVLLDEGIICIQSTPMFNSSGKLIGMLSTYYKKEHSFSEQELRILDLLAHQAWDVIEKKQFEKAIQQSEKNALKLVKELEEADRNKNKFISVLSHELRNPLAAISAGVQILDITQDISQTTKVKGVMKRQANQLCKLVDDLLELTRISQNKIKLKKENIDLNEIVKSVVEDMRHDYQKKGIKLGTKIQTKPILLSADPVRITQIIGNVLHNALKFTQENGTIRLTLKKEKNHAVISIKDNGIGISPEILPHLFTPFTQADNTLDRSRGGLGLGLSIVKGIVDLHEGNVSAFSDGVGKGSTFTIRLPITLGDNVLMEEQASDNDYKKSLNLLVIEDNRDFADLLSTMLSTIGYDVNIAHNGEDGLKMAKQIKPDVIFCDIGLPGMNGYDVAESIRNDNELKDIHLIALTGYAGESDVEHVLKAGFNKHMAKPIDLKTLKKVL